MDAWNVPAVATNPASDIPDAIPHTDTHSNVIVPKYGTCV